MRINGTSAYSTIQLAEDKKVPNKVQVLRVGKFNHPKYGYFEITTKTLSEMKANHDANIRGLDMAFDYFHKSDEDAAAWVKSLELSEDGQALFAVVDWTPTAEKKLAEREIRYFSPDFAFKWTDPERGTIHNNVLFGGGLTNRPFVKEMEAIVASEELELGGPGSGPQGGGGGGRTAARQERLAKSRSSQNKFNKKSSAIKKGIASKSANVNRSNMIKDLKASKAAAKLDESQNGGFLVDEKDKKIAELEAQLAALQGGGGEDDGMQADDSQAQMAQLSDANKKLSDENAMLKAEKQKADEAKELAEKAKVLAEKETSFNVLLSEGKACAAQKDAFLKDDMTAFIKLAQPVNLTGTGSSENSGDGEDVLKATLKLAEEKRKLDPKLDQGQAISLARKELAKK